MLADSLFLATAVAYLVACGLFFHQLASRAPSTAAARVAPWALGAALALHASYVVDASFVQRVCPVASVHFAFSVAALPAGALYLALRRRARLEPLGAFVAPFGLFAALGLRFSGAPDHQVGSGMLALHVTANLLGDALFLLASGAAVLYLVQEKRLKRKRAATVLRLPPLDSLDRAVHRFLLSGFPLLTLGILTGTVWAGRIESGSASEIARAAFAYATWFLFAAVLVLRTVAGWRGRRAAWGTIAGFACAMVVLLVYLVRGVPGGAS
jgi:ABC-type uncharacterized transport system permease subunit